MILIVDCGSSKTPYIEEMVDEFCDFKTIPFFDVTEEDTKNSHGIIFSGAPILITEINMERYINHVSWILDFDKPILGICFGHQLLGLLHGAMGSKMREDRDWQEIEVFVDCPLFDKLPSTFDMMEDHCESISIPGDFELVASSDVCVNEAMKHKVKPFFGVQFHPEVSGNYGRIVIENFIEITNKLTS
jgi:GMP synthase (glutamine-hydrolysing)